MKKLSTGLLLVVTVIIAVVVLVMSRDFDRSTDVTIGPGSGPTATVGPGGELATSDFTRPSDATLSHIAYVYDGDTLYLQPDGTSSRADEIKVRLIGIDTPELRPDLQCYGLEARDFLRGLLPKGTAVWIKADRQALDQYGRSLLYLWTTDGTSVNLDLVKKGYATELDIAPSNSYWQKFDAAESAAKLANAGLWGSC